MIETDFYGEALNLIEGRLCLDFANTADWHASGHPEERLNSYADLVAWAEQVGILTKDEAQHLYQEATLRPADTSEVLERAIDLREAIYRIFSAVAGGRPVEAATLSVLNAWLSAGLSRLQIIQTRTGFVWRWTGDQGALDQMLWPVAQSAAELLIAEELEWVKECADDRGCGWLFLDTSRNRSRKWCDMKGCGNRAKARRHYQRKRSASTGT